MEHKFRIKLLSRSMMRQNNRSKRICHMQVTGAGIDARDPYVTDILRFFSFIELKRKFAKK